MSKIGQLRQVALQLFATKGFEATGIRDLANALGVSTASLYYYMNTKEDLLLDIMFHSLTCSLEAVKAADATASTPEGKLVTFVRTHVIIEGAFPEEAIVVDGEIRALSPAARDKVVTLRDEYDAVLAEIIHAGCVAGVFSVPDETLTRLAILEAGIGLSRWFNTSGPRSLTEVADVYAELSLATVRAGGNSPMTVADVGARDSQWLYELVMTAYKSGGDRAAGLSPVS